jgi:cytochrome c-type biogenesis protein CcmE
MMTVRTKLLIGGLALAIGVGYLAFAGVRSGWVYFVDVDAFVAGGGRNGQRTRVHGVVGAEGLEIRRADLAANFQLVGERSVLSVAYKGPIPDMFDATRQVVIEGSMDQSGVFHADVLMTKCASKYEGHGENGPVRETTPTTTEPAR